MLKFVEYTGRLWYYEYDYMREKRKMAQMYFSKFNINSEIYEVYKDEGLKDKILKNVFDAMDEQRVYEETDRSTDEEDKTVTYKFCDLEKDETKMSITGRLVKIFQAELQSYDKKNDITIHTG